MVCYMDTFKKELDGGLKNILEKLTKLEENIANKGKEEINQENK